MQRNLATWAKEHIDRLEAVKTVFELAQQFPDVVLECAEVLGAEEQSTQSGARAEERQKKFELITQVIREAESPLSYKDIMEETDLTRSAIRNIIESQFSEAFESHLHGDGRTILWWPIESQGTLGSFFGAEDNSTDLDDI